MTLSPATIFWFSHESHLSPVSKRYEDLSVKKRSKNNVLVLNTILLEAHAFSDIILHIKEIIRAFENFIWSHKYKILEEVLTNEGLRIFIFLIML